jgi:hypothetical protein
VFVKFKPNYIIIPLIVILVNALGNFFQVDYYHLGRLFSSFPNELLPFALLEIPLLTLQTAVLLIFWNRFSHRESHFSATAGLFALFGLVGAVGYYLAMPQLGYSLIYVQMAAGFIIAALLGAHHLLLAAFLVLIYLTYFLLMSSLAYGLKFPLAYLATCLVVALGCWWYNSPKTALMLFLYTIFVTALIVVAQQYLLIF